MVWYFVMSFSLVFDQAETAYRVAVEMRTVSSFVISNRYARVRGDDSGYQAKCARMNAV